MPSKYEISTGRQVRSRKLQNGRRVERETQSVYSGDDLKETLGSGFHTIQPRRGNKVESTDHHRILTGGEVNWVRE